MIANERDRLGARRVFVHAASGHAAEDLRSLLALVPEARSCGLDPEGIAAAWGLGDAPERTCLVAFRAMPPGRARAPRVADLRSALGAAMRRALGSAVNPVVALSGGLDAPLALLAAREAGSRITHAIHLAVPDSAYDESDAARATAQALGLTLHEIRITAAELAAALPHAVRAAETPLYNLHPVSRAVVARVARERGHDVLVTGDGADQAARGAQEPADYVPIVAALTRAAGLALASPFLDDDVVDRLAAAPDPEKRGLRALASALGLPPFIAGRSKVPASAPPLPRAWFPSAARLAPFAALTRRLGVPCAWSEDDRHNVRLASLVAFVDAFELEVG